MFDKFIGQLPGLAVGVVLGAIATSALGRYLISIHADRSPDPVWVEPFTPGQVPELDFHLKKFSPSDY